MDWNLVIERQSEALKRVVVTLFAMTGLSARGQSTFFPQNGAQPQAVPLAEKVLPRPLRNSILGLLRPTEAALRRLIIIVARGLGAPPLRERKFAPPKYVQSVITLHGGVRSRLVWKAGAQFPQIIPLPPEPPAARLAFPLFDPSRRFGAGSRWIKQSAEPRIWGSDSAWSPLPERVDETDAARIGQRLEAIGRALDDLPKQALRYARWKARRDKTVKDTRTNPAAQSRPLRLTPLRAGSAYGLHRPGSPRREHEIDEVLRDLHYFAREAIKLDTS